LKEELAKAEIDLERLKRQWALHEATKKRNEMRHVEQLRPLKSSEAPFATEIVAQGGLGRDEERRKARYYRTKQPQRKVFEGSRHTRALSLLSPNSLANHGTSIGSNPGIAELMDSKAGMRSITDPNTKRSSTPVSVTNSGENGQQSRGTRDDIMNTGKQLVGDLKEGLWTFIEDLRQATVGDEAVHGIKSRASYNNPATQSPKGNERKTRSQAALNRMSMPPQPKPDMISPSVTDVDNVAGATLVLLSDDLTNKHPRSPPFPNPQRQNRIDATINDCMVDTDGWDKWDSPPPTGKSSPDLSTGTQNSEFVPWSPAASSPRTSTRYASS
jgi:hypothetical protein